ncbi:MAG: hypothetical protein ACRDHF_10220 [Tepidiformaceae bacterium]
MQPTPTTAREAAERTAQAVVSGNLAQLMSDITPEALTQMMQMSASAGGLSLTQMPALTGYELEEMGQTEDGEGEVFQVTFNSDAGNASIETTWRQVTGAWKITAVSLLSAEAAPSPDPPA